jgi:rhomboid protease GluP
VSVFQRKTTGSVVCPSCGSLVGVRDDKCYECGRANPGLWGFAPVLRQLGRDYGFAPFVIGASATLYLLAMLASGGDILGGGGIFGILAPNTNALLLFGASGGYPVFVEGKWWTVLSATWLHAGVLHILFNMMWVRNIGPSMVDIIGPGRTVIIYVVSGVTGFALSSFMGAYGPNLPFLSGASLTVGASASVFGLIGALMHYGRVSGSSLIREETKRFAIMGLVFGLVMPGIDNFAHGGGFLGGYLASKFFNPLTRERGDHLLIAAICLILSLAAVVLSIATGFERYRYLAL